ncbi:MAG: hypothetical protein AB2L12_03355 [Smithellaceae bacterium]
MFAALCLGSNNCREKPAMDLFNADGAIYTYRNYLHPGIECLKNIF